MAPQNTPFWHKDYFKLEIIEKKRTQKELSAIFFSVQKQDLNSPWEEVPCPLPHPGEGRTLITKEEGSM